MRESEVAQSCPTLSDPMDCSPPGSSVHGFSRQEYWSGVPLKICKTQTEQGKENCSLQRRRRAEQRGVRWQEDVLAEAERVGVADMGRGVGRGQTV